MSIFFRPHAWLVSGQFDPGPRFEATEAEIFRTEAARLRRERRRNRLGRILRLTLPAALCQTWVRRREERLLESELRRLEELSPHLLVDIGISLEEDSAVPSLEDDKRVEPLAGFERPDDAQDAPRRHRPVRSRNGAVYPLALSSEF